jgi:hypothetical protein
MHHGQERARPAHRHRARACLHRQHRGRHAGRVLSGGGPAKPSRQPLARARQPRAVQAHGHKQLLPPGRPLHRHQHSGGRRNAAARRPWRKQRRQARWRLSPGEHPSPEPGSGCRRSPATGQSSSQRQQSEQASALQALPPADPSAAKRIFCLGPGAAGPSPAPRCCTVPHQQARSEAQAAPAGSLGRGGAAAASTQAHQAAAGSGVSRRQRHKAQRRRQDLLRRQPAMRPAHKRGGNDVQLHRWAGSLDAA